MLSSFYSCVEPGINYCVYVGLCIWKPEILSWIWTFIVVNFKSRQVYFTPFQFCWVWNDKLILSSSNGCSWSFFLQGGMSYQIEGSIHILREQLQMKKWDGVLLILESFVFLRLSAKQLNLNMATSQISSLNFHQPWLSELYPTQQRLGNAGAKFNCLVVWIAAYSLSILVWEPCHFDFPWKFHCSAAVNGQELWIILSVFFQSESQFFLYF